MAAAYTGNMSALRAAIAKGDNVNAVIPGNQYTALMFAAIAGHTEALLLLLRHGADRHLRNRLNRSAGDMAQLAGQHACADILRVYVPADLFAALTSTDVPTGFRLIDSEVDALHTVCNSTTFRPEYILQRIDSFELRRADIAGVLDIAATAVARKAHNALVTLRLCYVSTLILQSLAQRTYSVAYVREAAANKAAGLLAAEGAKNDQFEPDSADLDEQDAAGWGAARLRELVKELHKDPESAESLFDAVVFGRAML